MIPDAELKNQGSEALADLKKWENTLGCLGYLKFLKIKSQQRWRRANLGDKRHGPGKKTDQGDSKDPEWNLSMRNILIQGHPIKLREGLWSETNKTGLEVSGQETPPGKGQPERGRHNVTLRGHQDQENDKAVHTNAHP